MNEERDLGELGLKGEVLGPDARRQARCRDALAGALRGIAIASLGRGIAVGSLARWALLPDPRPDALAVDAFVQSSGIRIQPWRIAYTTACVRSLTDSLRRIELMWFLTVCSLIDRA